MKLQSQQSRTAKVIAHLLGIRHLSLGLRTFAFAMAFWSIATPVFALPQYVHHGYFGCQSCHASPTGGGVLTPYGRSIASEKISTWATKNEEQPAHGAFGETPDWLLVGGNFRQLQTYLDNEKTKDGRYFTMQRDLEGGVHLGPLWLVSTIGQQSSAYPKDEAQKVISRRHFIRVDFGDEWTFRLGKFFPRFGLMIPAHHAGIRRGMGFDQGMETYNAEVMYGGETIEVTANAVIATLIERQISHDLDEQRGGYANVAISLLEQNRLSVSVGKIQSENRITIKDGAAAILSLGKVTLLSEIARQRVSGPGPEDSRTSVFTYNRLSGESVRGVSPYLVQEIKNTDITSAKSRVNVWGLGLQLHPRPHFEFDVIAGISAKTADYQYSNFGTFLFHYYL